MEELSDVDFHEPIDKYSKEVDKLLSTYGYHERFEWILKKKDEGNEAFKTCQHFKAIDIYIQALCAMDFSRKEY